VTARASSPSSDPSGAARDADVVIGDFLFEIDVVNGIGSQ
jgi:hypothetical protein